MFSEESEAFYQPRDITTLFTTTWYYKEKMILFIDVNYSEKQ
jgi:hypothetical protein